MAENVFKKDKAFLEKLLDEVTERDNLAEEIAADKKEIKSLESSIASEEKSIKNEIETTTSKRRNEIEGKFGKEFYQIANEKKSAETSRSKEKTKQVEKRVEHETKHLSDENRDYKKDFNRYLRENRVPLICRSEWFYWLYMPTNAKDVIMLLICMFLDLMGAPFLLVTALQQTAFAEYEDYRVKLLSVIIWAGWDILWIVVYFIVYINVKMKYSDVLKSCSDIRRKMQRNEKHMNEIKKSINKDDDEGKYNLDEHDKAIDDLNTREEELNYDKQKALEKFDKDTAPAIEEEIIKRRQPKVDADKERLEELLDNLEPKAAELDKQEKSIAQNYSSYIGSDMVKQDTIKKLIKVFDLGYADNVADAVAYYKSHKHDPELNG